MRDENNTAHGPGLPEKPHENAMVIALRKAGVAAVQQKSYPIPNEGEIVGDWVLDITAEEVLIDTKSIPAIGDAEISRSPSIPKLQGGVVFISLG